MLTIRVLRRLSAPSWRMYRWEDHFRRMRENEQFSELQFRRFSEADMRRHATTSLVLRLQQASRARQSGSSANAPVISDEAERRASGSPNSNRNSPNCAPRRPKATKRLLNYAAERANRVMSGLQ